MAESVMSSSTLADFVEVSEVPDLQVSKSVTEILQKLFYDSCPDAVDINIKSTQRLTSLTTGSWFYVRVSINSEIKLDILKDMNTSPYLCKLLKSMQQLESESHLCVQNYTSGETCQQNLVVQGANLVVQHEIRKKKSPRDSSLHLRVHQLQSHMMKECQLIYRFLQVMKIFRPKVTVQFSMKMGENVCRAKYWWAMLNLTVNFPLLISHQLTHFHFAMDVKQLNTLQAGYIRVQEDKDLKLAYDKEQGDFIATMTLNTSELECPSMPQAIPDMVSESAFYLHKTIYQTEEHYVKLSAIGPGTVSVKILEILERFNITSVGVYIPVTTESGQPSVITLTLLGHGWFPFDVSDVSGARLLGDLNLARLGLKLVSSSTDNSEGGTAHDLPASHWKLYVQSTNKHVPMNSFVLQLFLLINSTANQEHPVKDFSFVQKHLKTITDKASERLSCILRESLYKALQPWTEKGKTQTLVYKSIRSVSKAIRDVVSMSTRETFRQEVLGLLQVESTLDLEKKIQSKLMAISGRRHAGVWNSSSFDFQQDTAVDHNATQSVRNNTEAETSTDNEKHRPAYPVNIISYRNQKTPEVVVGKFGEDNKTPEIKEKSKDAAADDVSPFQQLADDLMGVIDNICNTAEEFGAEMPEEPCDKNMSDGKLMAELFYDTDDNVLSYNAMNTNKCRVDEDFNVCKYYNRQTGHKMKPFLNCSENLPCETSVSRPDMSRIKTESVLKRSFSFPKDLEHVQERSAKFYRALSGDRIVPQTLRWDYNDYHGDTSENSCSSQDYSGHQSLNNVETNKGHFRSMSQDFCTLDALHMSGRVNSDESTIRDTYLHSFINNKSADNKQRNEQNKFENELQETFDVISKFVDKSVDKEIIADIGGHLDSCHIQSQVKGNEFDRKNDIVNVVDKVEHADIACEIDNVAEAEARKEEDSDDWFDAAIAEVENWLD